MDYWLIFQSLVFFVMTWGGTMLDNVGEAVMLRLSSKAVSVGKSAEAFI